MRETLPMVVYVTAELMPELQRFALSLAIGLFTGLTAPSGHTNATEKQTETKTDQREGWLYTMCVFVFLCLSFYVSVSLCFCYVSVRLSTSICLTLPINV